MGLDKEIGSLKEGKRADLIIINPDSPTPVNEQSVLSFFFMTWQGRNVEHVFVDGVPVVKEGVLQTGDEEEIRETCNIEAKNLWRRNGIEV